MLYILDALGGFDYAIVNQARYSIRVITNSWGSGGPFDVNDPVNVASYAAYQRGITVLFAAGNDGPGEDTHNPYAVAPWVISVGAGEKISRLAGFSSRGKRGHTGTVSTWDGETWTWVNEPTVVAPGVRIISTRTHTGALPPLEAEADAELGVNAAYYTHMDGTSMATPHTAGIVALMLEANPQLQPDDVKRILKATATNMPGYESWEVGSGYVNAYNAVVNALGRRTDFGSVLNAGRTFNANAIIRPGSSMPFSVDFSPVGERDVFEFQVGPEVAMVTARARIPYNTAAIRITAPSGKSYGSAIALPSPVGSPDVAVSAPAEVGTWKLTAGGIGFVSGNDVDPLNVTNGYALPGTISGTITFTLSGGYTGLDDIAGHPAKGAIEVAVANRLIDSYSNGKYKPDQALTRGQLAQFAVMGLGVRQSLPLTGGFTFADAGTFAPYAEAVAARGAALRDRFQTARGLIRVSGNSFAPDAGVTRAELAYTLAQSLGLQAVAERLNADFAAGRKTMGVPYGNTMVPLADAGSIPADLKGYVQLALDLSLLNARFSLSQGPYDLQPTLSATFGPSDTVKRGDYAVAAVATMNAFLSGDVAAAYSAGNTTSTVPALSQASSTTTTATPGALTFEAPFPNPARTGATLRFSLPEATRVRLAVYDAMGREVARLADGEQAAGTHTFTLDASTLAAGTYVSRLEAGG
ncbi:MAG TPA: S8 family serine peptidase, partial [Rhodothermales bacterium]|nr:S8 family serine peptidase [Rhodothermales bacterium]